MGTPEYREGVPHWTLKNLLARQLRYCLDTDRPFLVGFREHCDNCHGLQNDREFPIIENLLEGVVSVDVEQSLGNRIPDIILHIKDDKPKIIEVIDTSPPVEAKLADYRAMGVDAFGVMAHTREDVLGMLSAPVKWLKALTLKECRQRQRERLRQLWDFLESTADATFGVQQPNSKFPESEEEFIREYEIMRKRMAKEEFYISSEGMMISSWDSRPAWQKFVVAGRTVSKADLFSVIGMTRLVADINGSTSPVFDTLYDMIAVIRHANGAERDTGRKVKPLAEYPNIEAIRWKSARDQLGDILLYFERVFHFDRALKREQEKDITVEEETCPHAFQEG